VRFLGIDPGLRITGYGCVEGLGQAARLIEAGVFRLGRERTPRSGAPDLAALMGGGRGARTAAAAILDPGAAVRVPSVSARLVELDTDFRSLLERLAPTHVAVEALFAHPKHPATAITMAHARGVLLLAVRRAGLPLIELRPAAVKRFLTGNGQASKEQMQAAIQTRLGLASAPKPPDVADALAIALCASWRHLTAGTQ
jgi:crossover junction endodeoxyribonuclease RuvC